MEFKINDNGEIVDTAANFFEAMNRCIQSNSKKPEKKIEEQPLGKAMLIIDMPRNCWDCPCCDGEYGMCMAIAGLEAVANTGRLNKCPLILIE